MNKIALIGSVCLDRASASGQAIRTTILYNELVSRYGNDSVYLINTHNKTNNKFHTIFRSLRGIIECRDIIVMVSSNGRKVYYPILAFLAKVLHKRVYNNVIGGNFAEYLRKNPMAQRWVATFTTNWIQMKKQLEELKELGIENAELLQNTKDIKILTEDELIPYSEKVYRFCTFSRISVAKGIEDAIHAVEELNRDAGQVVATLDIYGIPDSDYKERFEELAKGFSSDVVYKGYVPYNSSVETLKGYYALLFPTTFYGEGFPATVWDALAAGVPTIATDWRYNSEVVRDGVTGLIYPHQHPEQLKEKMLYAMTHREKMSQMSKECLREIGNYTPEKVFPVIFKYFDGIYGKTHR